MNSYSMNVSNQTVRVDTFILAKLSPGLRVPWDQHWRVLFTWSFLFFTWVILSNDKFFTNSDNSPLFFFFLITHLLKVDSLLCEFLLCLDNARRPGQCCSFVFFSHIQTNSTDQVSWHCQDIEIQKILANMPTSLWLRESYKAPVMFHVFLPSTYGNQHKLSLRNGTGEHCVL